MEGGPMTEVFITDQDVRVPYVEALAACFIFYV